jgi:hypothetical protein
MREIIELRVLERNASKLFGSDEGKPLGLVRVIHVDSNDPRIDEIKRLQEALHDNDDFLFAGCYKWFEYSPEELKKAELFRLHITAVFEPAGEDCGTVYEEGEACPICGAGASQRTVLVLDLRKAPKRKDIARTIADEWIVNQRLAELLLDSGMLGYRLGRVRHRARYEDDPFDLDATRSGRKLLQRAEQEQIARDSWEFYVWLNRADQAELTQKAQEEYVARRARKARQQPWKQLPPWYQLLITGKRPSVVGPTHFAINPLEEDVKGEYRCPKGHVAGLNLVSEVYVPRKEWDGSDILCTSTMVGLRSGVLRPTPILLVTPRVVRLLQENDVKGYRIERAHFV